MTCSICTKPIRAQWQEVCFACVKAMGWSFRKFGYRVPEEKRESPS
jgi:hypothetical protein